TEAELQALHLGLAVVGEAAEGDLQAAAKALAARLDEVLPGHRTAPATGWGRAAFPFAEAARGWTHLPALRRAIRDRRQLRILDEAAPARPQLIRPLELDYWGGIWSLTAYSETDGDFALIRLDRIATLEETGDGFADDPGTRLADYLDRYAAGPDGN